MKFFTLFSNQDVRIAPGKKVIPSEDFSTLASAGEILDQAEAEAENFKKEVAAEAELIKEKAFHEGFSQGLISLNHHLAALDKELKEIRNEIQKKILPLSLKAVRKIVGEELKLHPDRIVDIILTALKPVTQHRRVIIYVNRADLDLIEQNRSKIKKLFEHLENLSIQERGDIEPGGCIIETEAGIINAQLETQLNALESAFASFMVP